MSTDYSKEGILAQALIAFGQGMGALRISHNAAKKVQDHYACLFEVHKEDILKTWNEQAVQALERVRAVGRLLNSQVCAQGKTVCTEEDFASALKAHQAMRKSNDWDNTPWCDNPDGGG